MNEKPTIYSNSDKFEVAQRAAKMISSAEITPAPYKGNIANCMIAIEMAARMNTSPLMVMQNMNIIHGKPSWSSQFLIACLNASGRFSPIRYKTKGEGEGRSCVAVATDIASGEILEGPEVTMKMATSEGWSTKAGSKWKTMPDLMLMYRAATFFVRLYAPEIAAGLYTTDERADIAHSTPSPIEEINSAILEV